MPIIIPTPEQLQQSEELFDKAKAITDQQISQMLTKSQADELLADIQIEVDDLLYGVSK